MKISEVIMRGTRADQPDPWLEGLLYYVTDEEVLERDSGVTWESVESGVSIPIFSGAVLTKSGTQSVDSASETAISFDGEVFDTDAYHDNSTNNTRFTAPATGYYLVGGSAELEDVADAKYMIVHIRKEGTNNDGDGRARIYSSGAGTYFAAHFSRIVSLTSGQYVELTVEHNHGSARNVRTSANGTSFWIHRIA